MKKLNKILLVFAFFLATTLSYGASILVKTMPLSEGITTTGYVRVVVKITEGFTANDMGIILHEEPDFAGWDQGIGIMMFSAVGQPAQIRGYNGTTWDLVSVKNLKVGDEVALWFNVDIANAKHSLSAQTKFEKNVTSVYSDFTSRASTKGKPATNAKYCSVFVNDKNGILNASSIEIIEDAVIVTDIQPYYTPVTKAISYVDVTSGNSTDNPSEYMVGQGVESLENPLERTGYDFEGWFTDAALSATIDSPAISTSDDTDMTFYAKWHEISYFTVTYDANGGADGTITQEVVRENGNPTLAGNPTNTGYNLSGWKTAGGDDFTIASIVSASLNVLAQWELVPFNLTITADNGSVSKNPDLTELPQGSTVVLTATPDAGYEFVDWTGDVSSATKDNAVISVLMDADKSITANFNALPTYSITLTNNNGTVTTSPDTQDFVTGSMVILTATPNAGYEFANWTGDVQSNEAVISVTMDANKTLTANFTALPTYAITLTNTNGSVTKTPDAQDYVVGSVVTLTATPDAGYEFANWTGDVQSNNATVTVTMDANKAITANFTALPTYAITVTSANGTVTKTPDAAEYQAGTVVVLSATADQGYAFTSWTGDAAATEAQLTVTVNAAMNITANFDVAQSINATEATLQMLVSPNPSMGLFKITLADSQDASYKVYTIDGAEVLAGKFNAETTIDLNSKTGVYLLEVSSQNKRTVKKIVLTK